MDSTTYVIKGPLGEPVAEKTIPGNGVNVPGNIVIVLDEIQGELVSE